MNELSPYGTNTATAHWTELLLIKTAATLGVEKQLENHTLFICVHALDMRDG